MGMNANEFYDPTDDMLEDELIDPGHHFATDEDIFTDEYMQAFAEKMDAKIAREKRTDRIISFGVIATALIFTATIISIVF